MVFLPNEPYNLFKFIEVIVLAKKQIIGKTASSTGVFSYVLAGSTTLKTYTK